MKARSFKKFFVSIAQFLHFHPPLLFLQQLHNFHWQNSLQIRFRKTQILLLLMILMRKRQRLPILLLDPVSNRLLPL